MRTLFIIGLLIFTAGMITYPMVTEEANSSESVQSLCPVSGKPIDAAVFADHEGQRVYFDSEASRDLFAQDPKPYLEELEKQLSAAPAKSKSSDCGG